MKKGDKDMDDQQEILTLETSTIKDVIDSFIKHIDSLEDTYPLTTNAVEEADCSDPLELVQTHFR